MLVGADEHHRALIEGDTLAEVVAGVEIGGNAEVHDADQAIDGSGGSRPAEDEGMLVPGPDATFDDRSGILPEAGGLQPGSR